MSLTEYEWVSPLQRSCMHNPRLIIWLLLATTTKVPALVCPVGYLRRFACHCFASQMFMSLDLNGTVRLTTKGTALWQHRPRDDTVTTTVRRDASCCLSSPPSNLRFHPRFHAIDTFPRTEQHSPLADRLVLGHACVGRIFTVYWCIRVTFLYVPIFHFYHRASLHRSSPRARPRAQRRSPYDYSVISDFGHSRFIVCDAAWSVTGSTALEFVLFTFAPSSLFFARRILVSYYLSLAYKYPRVWPR